MTQIPLVLPKSILPKCQIHQSMKQFQLLVCHNLLYFLLLPSYFTCLFSVLILTASRSFVNNAPILDNDMMDNREKIAMYIDNAVNLHNRVSLLSGRKLLVYQKHNYKFIDDLICCLTDAL